MIQRFSTTASGEPGNGTLICQCYDNKTKFSKIHAQYPLKFIPTRGHADCLAVVYMISYGGGIVSGDQFNIQIEILPKAILLLLTQGNTKVFKDCIHQRQWMTLLAQKAQPTLPFKNIQPLGSNPTTTTPSPTSPIPSLISSSTSSSNTSSLSSTPTIENNKKNNMENTSTQIIKATISPGGILINMPDPVTSFKDSSFTSKQSIYLQDDTSQLVLLDWFTSGRMSRGEQWQFKYYASRIDVYINNRLKIKDHMVLEDDPLQQRENKKDELFDNNDESERETTYASKLKPYVCFATLIIIASNDSSSSLYQSIKAIIKKSEDIRMSPHLMKKDKDLLWSVSPCINNRGVLVRIAGMTTEMVRDFIKIECLGQGLKDIVGDGMFGKILM
ncbi:unnamed protein product [Cunninghamella blakesleeana]